MLKILSLAALAGTALAALASPAHAFLNTASIATCSSNNCGSVSESGATLRDPLNGAVPFVSQILVGGNECIRLEVFRQTDDLEMTVTTPNGTVFRDDDSAGSLRPLVKFVSTQAGAYTVTVSRFNGAPVDANFGFFYGRYNGANSNCATPTRPAFAPVHAAKIGALAQ